MLGPLVKAQLVALLTKKLLESPTFHAMVGAAHGSVSRLQESAYDALEQAVSEGDKLQSPARRAKTEAQRPTPDQPIGKQNDALHQFIERTKKELEEKQRQGK